MLTDLHPTNPRPWHRRPVSFSVAAHLVLLGFIVFRSQKPVDVTPTWLAYGNSQHTYKLVYFPPEGTDPPPEVAKLQFPPVSRALPRRIKPQPPKAAIEAQRPNTESIADAGDNNARAGSPLGTTIDGPVAGHEVHVAYPVVYPDPPVDRADLPQDLQGDVVIEVTIDSQGNVVETRIVQAIGHGIAEKIEATLRRWHYQPATLDGTPVASHHDVHFHFPS